MSKSKLLIALTAGVFAATATSGAFAQTSTGAGNDSAATDTATAAPAPAKKQKMRKHSGHASAGTKKTPAVETGNNAAASTGQSK
ncbi:hypothetical protein [Caballeronia sp. BR00000012568055]|uniref:hypothetical protein n=1 Tax=Caballeronia sp. BR00000012568055 TaxID=2918761 RepID=UPI0023F6D708|nr:hypothetical protein [Caballeronia sp. BR00000012568055]